MAKPGPKAQPISDRIAARVRIDPVTGCHVWTGTTNHGGYGRIGGRGYALLTHRVMYELVNGPIPPGLQIDHLCRNKPCCNPAHLEAVTPRENTLRSNAPSAKQARQTHCVHGHPFDAENTRLTKDGRRRCRACKKRHDRNYRYRDPVGGMHGHTRSGVSDEVPGRDHDLTTGEGG